MTERFNADFYVTCATVIPVLFVSLTVQAQSYESVLRRGERMPLPRRWLLLNGAYLYVVFGGIGELVALLALFERSDALGWRVIVLIATLLLLSAVIGGRSGGICAPCEMWYAGPAPAKVRSAALKPTRRRVLWLAASSTTPVHHVTPERESPGTQPPLRPAE